MVRTLLDHKQNGMYTLRSQTKWYVHSQTINKMVCTLLDHKQNGMYTLRSLKKWYVHF